MKKSVVIAVVLALTGCANSQHHPTHSIPKTDVPSISVNTPDQVSAERLVFLANGVAEIL